MSTHLTIWTLNKATDLLHGKEEEVIALFKNKKLAFSDNNRIECTFGNRNFHSSNVKSEIAHSLTYEPDVPDEYFVPIPLKCIGSKYKQVDGLDEEGKRLLKDIVQSFDCFNDEKYFQSFWDKGYGPLKKIRMSTINYSGYYEILEKTKPNILIGYSQGGLISRYLAFLDEYVFKQNAIHGIITIASPNYGSPLANPMNKESVIDGINALLLTLLSLNPDRYQFLNNYVDLKLDFDEVTDLIGNLLYDFDRDEKWVGSEQSLRNTLATASKWLSGLRDDPNTAFHDLSIMNFEKEFSVLNLVNNYPLKRIYYGSIVATNNDLDDFIKSLAGNVLGRLGWCFIKSKKLFKYKIKENIKRANDVYKNEIMSENSTVKECSNQQTRDIIKNYKEGILSAGIEAGAHDFIIPSICQILPESNDGRLLGNIINKRASHNSGKSRDYKPGKKNYKYVCDFLKKMIK